MIAENKKPIKNRQKKVLGFKKLLQDERTVIENAWV